MLNEFSRTALLLGEDAIEKLKNCRVAVFGVGGVGGYAAEALARSGVGTLDLVDNDVVSITNINRQIIALHSTVGRLKVEVMAERVRDINPQIKVNALNICYSTETASRFDFSAFDYVIDAIDTVSAKISLVLQSKAAGVRIISSMGAGNKLRPEMFEVADIYSTSVCPLARVMRTKLKKAGVGSLKVVYSRELPVAPRSNGGEVKPSGRPTPASCSFVPSAAGLVLAGEVIRDLTGKN